MERDRDRRDRDRRDRDSGLCVVLWNDIDVC